MLPASGLETISHVSRPSFLGVSCMRSQLDFEVVGCLMDFRTPKATPAVPLHGYPRTGRAEVH